MSELSRWWLAREKLRVETEKEGDIFYVTVNNHTPFPLPELGLTFLMFPSGVKEYIILNSQDNILARGKISAGQEIVIFIPGNPES